MNHLSWGLDIGLTNAANQDFGWNLLQATLAYILRANYTILDCIKFRT